MRLGLTCPNPTLSFALRHLCWQHRGQPPSFSGPSSTCSSRRISACWYPRKPLVHFTCGLQCLCYSIFARRCILANSRPGRWGRWCFPDLYPISHIGCSFASEMAWSETSGFSPSSLCALAVLISTSLASCPSSWPSPGSLFVGVVSVFAMLTGLFGVT